MPSKGFPSSEVPRFTFAATLEEQEEQLKSNPLMLRMRSARNDKADDPHRPIYHYVNPENTLNDPNGLCHWQGLWHLFFQARPPEDNRLHWGHAVSEDLIRWRDLPYALYPGPENGCYSGTTLVEQGRVIAMYHGTELGNMVAVSKDPLLLNWTKLNGRAVIPFGRSGELPKPYGVFDPCIWKKNGVYYALSAGLEPAKHTGRHAAADYLFRSVDLQHWEYLHPFVQGDHFTVPGDDGACPYFLPIGDRYILFFFSHMTGGQYLLGDYDRERDKFVVDSHGLCNFGATFPGGVHAPSATTDGNGGVIVLFNMNPAKPTIRPDDFLSYFFGGTDDQETLADAAASVDRDWDQIITLPRQFALTGSNELTIEPVEAVETLRGSHCRVQDVCLTANREVLLETISGNAIELAVSIQPGTSSMVELNVLRSPNKDEYTRICFYNRRGNKYREPLPNDVRSNRVMSTALSKPVRHESVISIDTSHSSILPNVVTRPPESAPVYLELEETVELRVFVDRSVVEVFVNGKQCVAVRVYPGREDSVGVSILSRNQESRLMSVDCWQMYNIYE